MNVSARLALGAMAITTLGGVGVDASKLDESPLRKTETLGGVTQLVVEQKGNVVETKNASGATLSSAVWFAVGHTAKQIGAVNDADDNGVPEIALTSIRDSDNRVLVEVKNVVGPTNTNSIWYSAGFTAQGMAVLNDTDNNTDEEVGVLMIRDSDSRILVQGRNAAGSKAARDFWFSP